MSDSAAQCRACGHKLRQRYGIAKEMRRDGQQKNEQGGDVDAYDITGWQIIYPFQQNMMGERKLSSNQAAKAYQPPRKNNYFHPPGMGSKMKG